MAGSALAADVYRSIDANGNVVYSDRPEGSQAQRVFVEDPTAPAPGADAFRWFFYASSPPWTNTRHSLSNVRGAQKEFPDMSALKAHWARVLGDLAQAFADGDAAVDPRRDACRYCEQRPLCRVDAVLGARATEPS